MACLMRLLIISCKLLLFLFLVTKGVGSYLNVINKSVFSFKVPYHEGYQSPIPSDPIGQGSRASEDGG